MLAVLPWLAWPAHCARASGHGDAGLRVATQGSGLVGLDGRLGISALVDATYGPRHSGVGVSWGVAAMTGAGDDNSRTYGVLGLTGAVDPFGDHRVETLLRFGAWAGAVVVVIVPFLI